VDRRAMREILVCLLARDQFTDSQRIDGFYLVCFGRSPTRQERQDGKKQIAQGRRHSAKADKYFDDLLYHPGFQRELAQVYRHVQKISAELRRGFQNPTFTWSGAVASVDEKVLRKNIFASARILAETKLPVSDQQKLNFGFFGVLLLTSLCLQSWLGSFIVHLTDRKNSLQP